MKNFLLPLFFVLLPFVSFAQCDDGSYEVVLQVQMYDYDWNDATEWYLTSSTGEVVASGPIPYSYDCNGYCGDVWCGFQPDECYTLSANGSWDGWIDDNLTTPEDCNTCTSDFAYLNTNSDQQSFCMPSACDGTLDYVSSYGWGSYEDVEWTITNLVTGEELFVGDVENNNSYDYLMIYLVINASKSLM